MVRDRATKNLAKIFTGDGEVSLHGSAKLLRKHSQDIAAT